MAITVKDHSAKKSKKKNFEIDDMNSCISQMCFLKLNNTRDISLTNRFTGG